jgi:hypothetical protein
LKIFIESLILFTLYLPSVNIFAGLLNNPIFVTIWVTTACLQAVIVQYGTVAFAVVKGGLSAKYWGYSIMFGLGSLPIQQIINVIYWLAQTYNISRNAKRTKKAAMLTTQAA